MVEILEKIFDILFPPVCGFCGKICKEHLCENCKKEIDAKSICKVEKIEDKYFDEKAYIMRYDGKLRDKILLYKFKEEAYLYKTFAKIVLNSKKICDILKTYDIIVPVPIHKKRKGLRGYNQSELIAREIAKNIDELKIANVLKKVKNNPRQSSLDKQNRIENVKNAYEIANKEIICNKRIILFDDIYTTGATANECSKVLKQNGAKYILVLSLAK